MASSAPSLAQLVLMVQSVPALTNWNPEAALLPVSIFLLISSHI
tara:strand:- start:295 stop:426 length:132 start_codon:yes stop_codon:yes gene_type:complete